MKALNFRTAIVCYLTGVLIIHLVVLWNARKMIWKGYSDFTIYYCAGTMLRQGLGRELYDDAAQFSVQRQFAPKVTSRLAALPYNHPPFEALLFEPLTHLSYPWAFMCWDALNLAMLFALPFLLSPYLSKLQVSGPFCVLASLAFFPIFFALLQGQDSILLLFLFALAFVDLAAGRDARAGAWLGVGLFKPQLILPFTLFMSLCGKRKLWYGFLPVAAVLGLLSVGIVGQHGLAAYPSYVLQLETTMARGAILPDDMPNLRGVLYLLLHGRGHIAAATLILSICLFVFAVMKGREVAREAEFPRQFALAAVATVLVSYHCLDYDLSILFVPMLLVLAQCSEISQHRERFAWLTFCGMAVLWFSPLQLWLLLRWHRLGWIGWAVLFLMFGIAARISKSKDLVSHGATT
jgi:hypothetical protein